MSKFDYPVGFTSRKELISIRLQDLDVVFSMSCNLNSLGKGGPKKILDHRTTVCTELSQSACA